MKLQVEYVSIDNIKPYERNAKLHPQEQVKQIKESIEQFGFNDPLALWHDEIVEGHGRYLAAKQLKLKTVPVIRLDELTDEERRAYMLVHNKLTMNSDFDVSLLGNELENIFDIDMSQFGFENEMITREDIEGGEIEEKSNEKLNVKIVFQNTKHWKMYEEKVREFVDTMENVSVSVGEYDEDQ